MAEKKVISKDEANYLVEYWKSSGMLEKWMNDPEMLSAEAKLSALLESGRLNKPVSPATEVMRQFRKGATKEEMVKAIEGITYTEEICEDIGLIVTSCHID